MRSGLRRLRVPEAVFRTRWKHPRGVPIRLSSTELSVKQEEEAPAEGQTEAFFDTLLEVVEKSWEQSQDVALGRVGQEKAGAIEGRRIKPEKQETPKIPTNMMLSTNTQDMAADSIQHLMSRQIENEQKALDDAIELFSKFAAGTDNWQGKMIRPFERLVREWCPIVAERIRKLVDSDNGRDSVRYYFKLIDPETVASLAVHNVLSATITGDQPLSSVSRSTGTQVITEISYRALRAAVAGKQTASSPSDELYDEEREARERAQDLIKNVESNMRSQRKLTSAENFGLQKMASLFQEDLASSKITATRLGAFCVSAVVESCQIVVDPETGNVSTLTSPSGDEEEPTLMITDMFSSVSMAETKKDVRYAFEHTLRRVPDTSRFQQTGFLRLTDALVDRLHEDIRLDALRMSPKFGPMLVEPKPWVSPNNGAYLITDTHIMRARHLYFHNRLLENADMQPVYDGLNALGKTTWKINRRVFRVAEELWKRGGDVAGLVKRTDEEVQAKEDFFEQFEGDTETTLEDRERAFRRQLYLTTKANHDRHSERCSTWYRLQAARDTRCYRKLYLPHNVDFRGAGEELGKSGLFWLKVHMANLLGADKMSLRERVEFVEDKIPNIFTIAANPLKEDVLDMWAHEEDPFQILACSFEIAQALRHGEQNGEDYVCSFPVHQDGSCNGLQHYAALGRDLSGGSSVNLIPQDQPADVYTQVLERVKVQMGLDAEEGKEAAILLLPLINRKVVKQTVMTSVYGVTGYGAREQVRKQLRGLKGVPDRIIGTGGAYIAELVLSSLGDLFKHAQQTMGWLSESAAKIARSDQAVHWITPLGLPCIQPYHRQASSRMKTTLSTMVLQHNLSGEEEVNISRQKAAFPPNFIHSLDSSHMLMTASRCNQAGLQFGAVHDSFWTTPNRIPVMNKILREAFVDLHSRPLLEELREHFLLCYPSIEFSDVPEKGTLNLSTVLDSQFFFD